MRFSRAVVCVVALVSWLLVMVTEATLSQLGNLFIITPQQIETDPHAGYRDQRDFESKHGPQGSLLVESLGSGQNHHQQRLSDNQHRRSDLGPVFYYNSGR